MTIEITRRDVLVTGAAGAAILPTDARALPAASTHAGVAAPSAGPEQIDVVLSVNARDLHLSIDPRTSLLDALRDYAGLVGTKKGCDMGSCGACTVHVDGERVVSCLLLAQRLEGRAITTIEGMGHEDAPHPVQAAFVSHDALQCGYCTPGQIMSASALLEEGHTGSDDEVREWMSGNICRCGAYPNIVAAIRDLAVRRS